MRRVVPLGIGLAIVLATGVVHGIWTDRWHLSNEPAASVEKLTRVPLQIGDWQSEDLPELDTQTLAVGEIAGYMNRTFVNTKTRERLSVLIVCGRPGPIAQHSPEVCMGGEGFVVENKTVDKDFPADGLAGPPQFFAAVFKKTDAGAPLLRRVFWAWSTSDGVWTAPGSPRMQFAGKPALYKMYLVHNMSAANEPLNQDIAHDLAKVLLPQLQKDLFSGS
jgi:hypothetical protein